MLHISAAMRRLLAAIERMGEPWILTADGLIRHPTWTSGHRKDLCDPLSAYARHVGKPCANTSVFTLREATRLSEEELLLAVAAIDCDKSADAGDLRRLFLKACHLEEDDENCRSPGPDAAP